MVRPCNADAIPNSNQNGMPDPSPQTVRMLFSTVPVYIWGLTHQLGGTCRDVNELKAAGLLCNNVEEIAKQGYGHNFGISESESLVSLSAGPVSSLMQHGDRPQALVFHHSYAASAAPASDGVLSAGFMPHAQYFPAALLRELNLDHIPYIGSFETGCTGLFSMIMTASGMAAFSIRGPVGCATCDIKPRGTTYDALREKILTSDCSSAFLLGQEPRGYRVLGISYYSTHRVLVPLVEIVKRTVQMVRELTDALAMTGAQHEYTIHYPNIFPSAWPMVTNYLRLTHEPQQLDGLFERAHCLSSDPIISLASRHRGRSGRIHIVVNFGSGLHLAVGLFKEEAVL